MYRPDFDPEAPHPFHHKRWKRFMKMHERFGRDGFWGSPRGPHPFGGHFGGPFGGDPFGGDPSDPDGGGRRRFRRGDIKYALLELLAEQPRHGYDLIRELERRNGGFYRPSPGSVYPTLQLLEDEGYVTSETVEGKRVYEITDAGREFLEAQPQRPGPFERPGHHERGKQKLQELNELRQVSMAFAGMLMQVGRHASSEQIRAVIEQIEATQRKVYAILAEEKSAPSEKKDQPEA